MRRQRVKSMGLQQPPTFTIAATADLHMADIIVGVLTYDAPECKSDEMPVPLSAISSAYGESNDTWMNFLELMWDTARLYYPLPAGVDVNDVPNEGYPADFYATLMRTQEELFRVRYQRRLSTQQKWLGLLARVMFALHNVQGENAFIIVRRPNLPVMTIALYAERIARAIVSS